MGMERGYIFHLDMLQLSSLSLLRVNQCAVCCDLSRKEELLFITTSLTPQKTAYSPEACIYREGRADSTREVQYLFSTQCVGY